MTLVIELSLDYNPCITILSDFIWDLTYYLKELTYDDLEDVVEADNASSGGSSAPPLPPHPEVEQVLSFFISFLADLGQSLNYVDYVNL